MKEIVKLGFDSAVKAIDGTKTVMYKHGVWNPYYERNTEDVKKSIITPIFYQLIVLISENIYALILVFIFGNNFEQLLQTIGGLLLTNISVALLTIILSTRKTIIKL